MGTRCLILVGVMIMVAMVGEAWAKVSGPKEVTPVVAAGVKYVAPNDNGREGRVEAYDVDNGKKLWDMVVYTIKIDPNLEEDVQWVFITELAVSDNTLRVTNQQGAGYKVDLTTKKVEKTEKIKE